MVAACLPRDAGRLRRAFSRHQEAAIQDGSFQDARIQGGPSGTSLLPKRQARPLLIFRAQRQAEPVRHQAKRHQALPAPAFEGVQASSAFQALALQALAFGAEQVLAVVRLGAQRQEWLEHGPFPLKAPAAGHSFSNPQAPALSMHARSSWDLRSSPTSPDVFNPVVRLLHQSRRRT
jgi:hypothetical protein